MGDDLDDEDEDDDSFDDAGSSEGDASEESVEEVSEVKPKKSIGFNRAAPAKKTAAKPLIGKRSER